VPIGAHADAVTVRWPVPVDVFEAACATLTPGLRHTRLPPLRTVRPLGTRPAMSRFPSVVLVVLAIGCTAKDPTQPPAPVCAPSAPGSSLEPGNRPSAQLALDIGPMGAAVAEDARAHLATLWGVNVEVVQGPPTDASAFQVWVHSAAEEPAGYRVLREDARVTIRSNKPGDAVAGYFAFLELLGARFFHPLESYVPSLGSIRLPAQVNLQRTPMTAVRGIHLHLLHPTEYLAAFNVASPQNLENALRFVDWLVHTGQNHVQWWILQAMDWQTWRPHANAIIQHAHARGVTVGVEVMMWSGSSFQGGVELIQNRSVWQQQMEAGVEDILQVPFDQLEVNLGEFTNTQPEELITWLDTTTAYIRTHHPAVAFSVVNHVGNYENLYLDFRGQQDVFFYHLPGYADSRLINAVHTVGWYDLYRPAGMYEHADFNLHRDFILRQLPQRKVRYFPESAYWVSADVDVPMLLMEYSHARWWDIHHLHRDITDMGLPPLDGHVVFSSGHEWGYWLGDYVAARALWDPEASYESHLAHVMDIHEGCSEVATAALVGAAAVQTQHLFGGDIMGYLSGEDLHDDLGALGNILTHPRRVQFEELVTMDAAGRAAHHQTLDRLMAFEGAIQEHTVRMSAVCSVLEPVRARWCHELAAGINMTRLRAQHSRLLNEAVLAALENPESNWESTLRAASETRAAAAAEIQRREAHYRFPLAELATAYDNLTVYEFGYLKQASDQCFWRRQEMQADAVIRQGAAPPLLIIPTCLE
jgi:hypothetical protein